ncbi:uncharacterized protein [Porites lutea]|uniref:uncharacterized protein n=1 Tax=Porites lutea TaxID=51062 RepID=UPI003CC54AA0
MGCSAGKHLTTSPELSTSSHSTKENGHATHTPDVPRHSLESSTHNLKRKDSSNSVSSVKEPDIPDPNNDMYSVISTKKVDERTFARRPIPINRSSESCGAPPKPIPINQVRVQMTKSQTEFFKMLDKKIDEGPDYISETDS